MRASLTVRDDRIEVSVTTPSPYLLVLSKPRSRGLRPPMPPPVCLLRSNRYRTPSWLLRGNWYSVLRKYWSRALSSGTSRSPTGTRGDVTTLVVPLRSPSYDPKKCHWFFTIGPPRNPPARCSLKGAVPDFCAFENGFCASSELSRSNAKTRPSNLLVPDRVTTLTSAPAAWPCSGENWLV